MIKRNCFTESKFGSLEFAADATKTKSVKCPVHTNVKKIPPPARPTPKPNQWPSPMRVQIFFIWNYFFFFDGGVNAGIVVAAGGWFVFVNCICKIPSSVLTVMYSAMPDE